MPLTDSKVKNAKPKEKEYKLADAHGLYLLVKPNGGKYWRLKYRFGRKEKKLSIGVYPSISLKAARKQQAQAKLSLVEGRDPSESKRMIKVQSSFNQSNTFSSVAQRIKEQVSFYIPSINLEEINFYTSDDDTSLQFNEVRVAIKYNILPFNERDQLIITSTMTN